MNGLKYKVGDYVRIKSLDWYNENKDNYGGIYAGNGFVFWKNMVRHCGEIMKITTVKVDPEDSNKGYYFMENSEEKWTDEMIEGLVEEKTLIERFDDNGLPFNEWLSHRGAFHIPEGYILKDENDNVINATKVVLEKKKKEYPKTYAECCEVLRIPLLKNDVEGYKWQLLVGFQDLLIARDAYWKLAGAEMGLGKPWEPDYSSTFENGTPIKYVIYNIGTHIVKERKSSPNHILSFPTEEMRDAFYENFKELIEECKELL